jgi:hypothetical protein
VATKRDRVGEARRGDRRSTPVVIVPAQTVDQIDRRRIIRETLHDATATVVRGGIRSRANKQVTK